MDAKYDSIGDDYDTTRSADPAILSELGKLLQIQSNKIYLDAACGTGNYTVEISKLGGSWHAFDHSEKMLQEARGKSNIVKWSRFGVEKLAYDSKMFDGAFCSLAIHHFPDLHLAFSELARILKPAANFVIFTATPEQMRGYWLCDYFPKLMELSCDQMPTFQQVENALFHAGFTIHTQKPFSINPDLKDFFLYSGKQRPEMYLSKKVRNGISSFHNFCTATELQSGLEKIRTDIESGRIFKIMDKYQNSLGDYLFIRAIRS